MDFYLDLCIDLAVSVYLCLMHLMEATNRWQFLYHQAAAFTTYFSSLLVVFSMHLESRFLAIRFFHMNPFPFL